MDNICLFDTINIADHDYYIIAYITKGHLKELTKVAYTSHDCTHQKHWDGSYLNPTGLVGYPTPSGFKYTLPHNVLVNAQCTITFLPGQ